jgi:hypothetical protein
MMIVFVVILNLAISLINFYLAWRLWQWRRSLAEMNSIFSNLEAIAKVSLRGATRIIRPEPVQACRILYLQLEQQINLIRRTIVVVAWVYRLWQQRTPPYNLSNIKII